MPALHLPFYSRLPAPLLPLSAPERGLGGEVAPERGLGGEVVQRKRLMTDLCYIALLLLFFAAAALLVRGCDALYKGESDD